MNERIKTVRTMSGLTQKQFADKLGITAPSISMMEAGKSNPSEQTIRMICKEFGVNRLWLEEGEGPMRMDADQDDEIIDSVLAGSDDFVKAVIRGIAKSPGGWEKMREVFTAIQQELEKEKSKHP